jgi:hypothetical protein
MVTLILLTMAERRSFACDFCAVYAATEAQAERGRGFFAGSAEQFTCFGTFQSGGHNALNPDAEHLNSLMSQVFAGYNFNNRIGIQFNLPVIYREFSRTGAQDSETGLGDAVLLANLRLYQKHTIDFTFSWTGSAGVKFPTGDSHHLNPAEQDFAAGIGGHDLALGSGSFDGLLDTGLFFRRHRAFLTGNLQYEIRSEGEFGYQFANDLSWSGGPGVYLLLADDYSLSLQTMLSGESKGEDTIRGAPTEDTAETILYVGPQVNFTWETRLSAAIGADLPVIIHSTGDQLMPEYRVHAALTWRF